MTDRDHQPLRSDQIRRVARTSTSTPTSNVLTLMTHTLTVATDYYPEELAENEESFELRGKGAADGYSEVRRPSQDALEIDDVIVLEFEGLIDRGRYSLLLHGADGETSLVFDDVPLEELSRLSSEIDDEIGVQEEKHKIGIS